ncbi:MAG: hypothetical protein GPOALKHO_001840 [Sodalis sp.]|nr:MAG: hypothetical protein GPOALKHO_001840 [Sodalis sp.]
MNGDLHLEKIVGHDLQGLSGTFHYNNGNGDSTLLMGNGLAGR